MTAAANEDPRIGEVLRFWFEEHDRRDWFGKDARFDALVRERFLALYEAAATGALAHWSGTPRGALALVLVLDQFPRHLFRGEARAYATDAPARAAAEQAIARGWDRELRPIERLFLYLPYEHSESLEDQWRALALVAPLAVWPETADAYRWAVRHWEVIGRFGRFPHRNAALGRACTAEEEAFLREAGSRF